MLFAGWTSVMSERELHPELGEVPAYGGPGLDRAVRAVDVPA